MVKNKIEIITCESGDWDVLKLNGEIHAEGHSISHYEWRLLLEKLGCEVSEKEILDEDMEEGNY